MAKPKDLQLQQAIITYLQTVDRANLYQIGKFCNKTASAVKPYLEALLILKIVKDEHVIEDGLGKRYFTLIKNSPSPDALPSPSETSPIILPEFLSTLSSVEIEEKLLNYYRRVESGFAIIQQERISDNLKASKKAEGAWELFLEGVAQTFNMENPDESEILTKLEQEHNDAVDMLQELSIFLKQLKGEYVNE